MYHPLVASWKPQDAKILNAITEHQGNFVLTKMSWDKISYSCSDRQSVHCRVCPVQQMLINADPSQISSNLDELAKQTGEKQEKKIYSCVFLTLAFTVIFHAIPLLGI